MFWDASALVPLCLEQPRTAQVRALHAEDPELLVWWGSVVECASAIARLHREELLGVQDEAHARALLSMLKSSWSEVQPGDALRDQAMRLLRLHSLRAADALQLAAAIEWAGPSPDAMFVTFDERLGAAAQREGFRTL